MWTNAALNDNGVLTVSSTHKYGAPFTVDSITDGLPNTFWHSEEAKVNEGPSWVNYALNNLQTITQVTVGVRQGLYTYKKNIIRKIIDDCCRKWYNNMCVTLNGSNGSELAKQCTSGDSGEPFLAQDKNNIIIPFDSPINDVKDIKISFEDEEYGQVESLIVEGFLQTSKSFELSPF